MPSPFDSLPPAPPLPPIGQGIGIAPPQHSKPSFDEWYQAKEGHDFDSWAEEQLISRVMKHLARSMRDYATNMARLP